MRATNRFAALTITRPGRRRTACRRPTATGPLDAVGVGHGEVVGGDDTFDHVGEHRRPGAASQSDRDDGAPLMAPQSSDRPNPDEVGCGSSVRRGRACDSRRPVPAAAAAKRRVAPGSIPRSVLRGCDTTVRGSVVAVSDDPMPDRSMEHLDKLLWMIETNGWALEPVAARPDLDPPRRGVHVHSGTRGDVRLPGGRGVRADAGARAASSAS